MRCFPSFLRAENRSCVSSIPTFHGGRMRESISLLAILDMDPRLRGGDES